MNEGLSRNFAQKLDRTLSQFKISQAELARRSAMARSTIAKFQTGLRIPHPEMTFSIAKALDLSVNVYLDLVAAANSDRFQAFARRILPQTGSMEKVNIMNGVKDGYLENGTPLNVYVFLLTAKEYPLIYDQTPPDNRLLMEAYFNTHSTVEELGRLNGVTKTGIRRKIFDTLEETYDNFKYFLDYQGVDIESVYQRTETLRLKNPNAHKRRRTRIAQSLKNRVFTGPWRKKLSESQKFWWYDYKERKAASEVKPPTLDEIWQKFLHGDHE